MKLTADGRTGMPGRLVRAPPEMVGEYARAHATTRLHWMVDTNALGCHLTRWLVHWHLHLVCFHMIYLWYIIILKLIHVYSFDGVRNFYFVEEYSSFFGGWGRVIFCGCLIYFHHDFIFSTIIADGGWSSWEAWSSCSVSCGVGVQSRSRRCSNPAPYGGGKDCSGNSIESSTCDAGICVGKCSVVFKAIN